MNWGFGLMPITAPGRKTWGAKSPAQSSPSYRSFLRYNRSCPMVHYKKAWPPYGGQASLGMQRNHLPVTHHCVRVPNLASGCFIIPRENRRAVMRVGLYCYHMLASSPELVRACYCAETYSCGKGALLFERSHPASVMDRLSGPRKQQSAPNGGRRFRPEDIDEFLAARVNGH